MTTAAVPDLVTAAELLRKRKLPRFPRVVSDRTGDYLVLEDRRRYRIPEDPVKALGLLDHLGSKTWADAGFLVRAIRRISAARDWPIHPF